MAYRTFTFYGGPFQDPSTTGAFITPYCYPQPQSEDWFGLDPLSLAATDGVSVDFLSYR